MLAASASFSPSPHSRTAISSIEPSSRPLAIVAREAILAISHEIAFADDADEVTFLIDHRQRTTSFCAISFAASAMVSSGPTVMTSRTITSIALIAASLCYIQSFIQRTLLNRTYKAADNIIAAGSVKTHASAMFLKVDICRPDPFAAIVPATPDESTWVVDTGNP